MKELDAIRIRSIETCLNENKFFFWTENNSPRRIDDTERPAHGNRVRRWRCRPNGRCPEAAEPPSGNMHRPSPYDSGEAGSAPGIQFRQRWRWTGCVDDETGIR